MKILLQDYYMNGKGKSKVLIKFLLNFRQSGDVLFFLNARRLRGYTATVALNYGKRQKQLKKNDPSTEYLVRPQIYDQAYPGMLSTASPGNPVGATKPSFLLLFPQSNENSLEESTLFRGTYFLT